MGEFANICDHVATTMASSTDPLKPFKPSSIHAWLDLEQQLINYDMSQSLVALLSHTPGCTLGHSGSSDKKYLNTKCPSPVGHILPDCWAPGGGMEGKCDEVLAATVEKQRGMLKWKDQTLQTLLVFIMINLAEHTLLMLLDMVYSWQHRRLLQALRSCLKVNLLA